MPALIARLVLVGVLVPLNLPVFRWAWRVCFGTMEEFETCIGYVLELKLVSLFKFELHHSAYASFKVALFAVICLGLLAVEFVGLLLLFQAAGDILGALRRG